MLEEMPEKCAECGASWAACPCVAGPFHTPVPDEPEEEMSERHKYGDARSSAGRNEEVGSPPPKRVYLDNLTRNAWKLPPGSPFEPVLTPTPGDPEEKKVFASRYTGLEMDLGISGGSHTKEFVVPSDHGADPGPPPIPPDPERERLEIESPSEIEGVTRGFQSEFCNTPRGYRPTACGQVISMTSDHSSCGVCRSLRSKRSAEDLLRDLLSAEETCLRQALCIRDLEGELIDRNASQWCGHPFGWTSPFVRDEREKALRRAKCMGCEFGIMLDERDSLRAQVDELRWELEDLRVERREATEVQDGRAE